MDPRRRIPHDDWADQDLLTKSEAAERLAAEITEVTAKLSGPDAGSGAAREMLERRLNGLKEAHKHLTEGT
ncbi:hypothetical protein BST27_04335 [Mycobacterium intermedium]|uniref:Uncharacterized protein n=1 Tax=Mycobacterium intermedium TaxID=28445 RepID=A0A1E3SGW9_MYCIE|nr:hypothetical protein [Mycobacterium intermedium]MCV6966216.1 hypothetical protein [Mycobacterium intermedium]ODR00903.1 hypothetical protein BHQ20_10885 [Mycobacterium intermedium]OPE52038.1 hypothetical protein BV508_03880 [Mycobacterium intermedium]ORB09795.1 hypothetical protein BST27_04335 [Mycobacterium intermedium]